MWCRDELPRDFTCTRFLWTSQLQRMLGNLSLQRLCVRVQMLCDFEPQVVAINFAKAEPRFLFEIVFRFETSDPTSLISSRSSDSAGTWGCET